MEILDADGKLFGRVNAIDALVVLLVAAVLTAGVALVVGVDSNTEQPSASAQFITVSVGPISDDTADALASVDSLSLVGRDASLNVTDTVRTPHPNRDATLLLFRVRAPGSAVRATLGEQFDVATARFSFNVTRSALATERSIETSQRSVTVETTVSDRVAGAVSAGDTFRLGDKSVATITDVRRFRTADAGSRLQLSLDVRAVRADGTDHFASRPLRLGATIPFRTDAYEITGTVVSRNRTVQARENLTVRTRTVVPGNVATTIEAGDEYTVGDRPVASIEAVETYPIADSERRRILTTLRLQTVRTDGQRAFLGESVRVGAQIPFDAGSYRFNSTVTGTNVSTNRTPVETTLRIRWADVSPEIADAVEPGLTEQHPGADATIEAVSREPATVVLTTEGGEIYAREHPVNEDVTLTVSARTYRQNGRPTFHGRPVKSGDTVVLEFGSVTVEGTVVGLTVDE